MIAAVKLQGTNILSILSGITLGLVLLPALLLGTDTMFALYDTVQPVTKMELVGQKLTDDTLRFQFKVTRLRDCRVMGFSGFSGNSLDAMQPATEMRREDAGAVAHYPVGITIISPHWLMRPIYGKHVQIYGLFNCSDRYLQVLVIDHLIP